MRRHWVSWWSGYYQDEGGTKPPFKVWISGYRDRPNVAKAPRSREVPRTTDDEDARNECSICAVIDAANEADIWELVESHFPDFEGRFCEEKPNNWQPGSRFP